MKKEFWVIGLVLICLSFLKLYSQEVKMDTWQKIESLDHRFGIKIPPTWTIVAKDNNGNYIFHSTNNPKDANNLVVELNCKSIEKSVTLDKYFEDSKSYSKSRYKEFAYVDNRDDKINGVPTKWFNFTFIDLDMKRQGIEYCVVYNGKGYNMTFSGNIAIFNDQTEFLSNIMNSLNVADYQPCATVKLSPPEKWFTSQEKGFLFVFSAKDNGGKSPSDGVIKVKQEKLSKNMSQDEYVMQKLNDIKKENPHATVSGIATIPNLNGQMIKWFDVTDKDGIILERYYTTVHQKCAYTMTHVCGQTKFENELKMVFASSLKTFTLEK